MELSVKNVEGEPVGQITVADVLFGAPINEALVHQVLIAQQANRRAGTHSTKTRGMVAGGGRKPRPQKHTGGARQGSIRAPQWRGGGVVFGPHPRSYAQQVNKKMRRLAIRSALSSRVLSDELIVLDALPVETPRTAEMRRILNNIGANRSTLVVLGELNVAVLLSTRNLPKVRVLPASRLNVEDLLRYHRVVITTDGIRVAEEFWARALTKRELSEATT